MTKNLKLYVPNAGTKEAIMCYDDFDFDDYDDMDDDFSEDLIDEEFESELDETNSLDEFNEEIIQESAFDFQEAFIIGGMIVGQAYEDGLDEKEQRNKKGNDDGDDSI